MTERHVGTKFDFLQNISKDINTDVAVEKLLAVLEQADDYTAKHSARVSNHTVFLAKKLGLSEPTILSARVGSTLHDIGKVDPPIMEIVKLIEKEPYSPGNQLIIKAHPIVGALIMNHFDSLQEHTDIPLYHHERWDGSGYPFGLAGKNIPLLARIAAITDVYDAINSNRPYRQDDHDARQYILKNAGTLFDPALVKVFDETLNEYERVK
jgi:putative nucleotidyltransferase with HDIG domain